LALGAGLFQFFYTQLDFSGQKNAKCAQNSKKNANWDILRKFQTAVPPKVLGIRANP
jgi:hypothetical protein